MLPYAQSADASSAADSAPPIVRVAALEALPFLNHGFSTRACGNQATRYGSPAEVANARRNFAELVGINSQRVAHFALTHSSRVGLVSEADAVAIDETPYRISIRGLLSDAGPRDLSFTNVQGVPNQQGVDCLITTTPGVGLFMVVGDAAPVILADRHGKVVALAQSVTWGQVVSETFFNEYGPHGPGIVVRNEQYFFDLPAAITDVLRREGLLPSMIHSMNMCTACPNTPFFSHHAGVAGRFGALVALK